MKLMLRRKNLSWFGAYRILRIRPGDGHAVAQHYLPLDHLIQNTDPALVGYEMEIGGVIAGGADPSPIGMVQASAAYLKGKL